MNNTKYCIQCEQDNKKIKELQNKLSIAVEALNECSHIYKSRIADEAIQKIKGQLCE